MGVYPIIGYLFLALVFWGFSVFLFHKTSYAPYVYVLIGLYFTSKMSDPARNDFLKVCFGDYRYKQLRLMENLMVSLPFAVFLIYERQFVPLLLLIVTAVLMAFSNFKTTLNFTIPTPFSKKPFEFTVGFRNTFYLFFIAYLLTVIAIAVDNFNLGMFSLALIFITTLTYYLKPENEYFVWIYSLTPLKFLRSKIGTAYRYAFYLSLPVILMLGAFFFEHIGVLLLFTLLCNLYLTLIILAKYYAYPHEMNLAQAIITGLAFAFPPLLLAIIPFFACQSVNSLKTLFFNDHTEYRDDNHHESF
jgi:hypothetical protein